MKEEYNYTLTVPVEDLDKARTLLEQLQANIPQARITRKPDRGDMVRFYLCFPYSGRRIDAAVPDFFAHHGDNSWDLFGPNYGVWGLK
ncbi:hypothetical protein [Desulforhopalus singaporensis]|uniref:Uncharacterized protein n=1 Tax=Desulforhopalus singaporensis TaxID=91360 RepID=A0A1H0S429_9BACT|nr:hypothetical protein [Desulforhopalus singaporensis]SDP36444.1 hypothetical protein SAMN05660330_02525 [Desulforhopalus singaporensis]